MLEWMDEWVAWCGFYGRVEQAGFSSVGVVASGIGMGEGE